MPAVWSGWHALEAGELLGGLHQRHAAADDDAFLNRGAGRVQRVVDAVLALLHLDFGGAADADHRDAAGELRQPLLQLLLVVVRRGLLDLLLRIWATRASISAFSP
jgi:hypothetical protein